MRDTPETDATYQFGMGRVSVSFARRLERERDEAIKELGKKCIMFDKLFDEAERIRIDRDKALKLLAVARSIHGSLPFPE